jgi:flavodoxin I
MSNIAVVYWSGTGNTEKMAEKVKEGAEAAGASVTVYTADSFTPDDASKYDGIAFGCPAMGSEELEESEFQPMWDSVKNSISDKKIGLFGSYGWGGGAWMQTWEDEAKNLKLNVVSTVISEDLPDDEVQTECIELGKALC